MATRCRGRARPGDILAAADHNNPADDPAEQERSLAGWDNEGGDTRAVRRWYARHIDAASRGVSFQFMNLAGATTLSRAGDS
ncbi:MAG: hypothetical protein HOW71_29755 [Nonomuraea sp.]|nr:hypothetical protein [Nonomuraea sp.]